MQDLIAKFDRVFIHADSVDSLVAQRVYSLFPREQIEIVTSRPFPESEGELSAREFSRSKRMLYLCQYPGQFFKRCPGSRPGLACCNYFVLNWGLQCDMNCSYCYLQSFINTPVLTVYTNLDDALTELEQMGETMRDHAMRVGTGETVDSLSLDEITLYSRRLIHFFSHYPKWSLEFKTKSAKVDQFLETPHAGNVIVSWSLNAQNIIEAEEHGTASLAERLSAARRCADKGFKLAFHIDPMIWHPEWRESYLGLVKEIASAFTPKEVSYMSVGALRFQPEQRHMMRERFGLKSNVTRAETFIGNDGKLRYDATVRQEMFQSIIDGFTAIDPAWRIFMCMETPETWLKTAGQSPFKKDELHDLFDPSVLTAAAKVDLNLDTQFRLNL
jgi:spore photoproduct lyase